MGNWEFCYIPPEMYLEPPSFLNEQRVGKVEFLMQVMCADESGVSKNELGLNLKPVDEHPRVRSDR